VDRDRERQQLLDAAQTLPALIVVIGRRRIGKGFLLERTFAGDRVVSFQGDEQDESRPVRDDRVAALAVAHSLARAR